MSPFIKKFFKKIRFKLFGNLNNKEGITEKEFKYFTIDLKKDTNLG